MSTNDKSFEGNTYSQIFATLKHPIRREIIRRLAEGPKSYTDLLNCLGIDSPRLSYHLQGLGDLVNKAENGRYFLSTIGEATIRLMKGVEEPVPSVKSKLWRKLQIVGVILSAAGFIMISISQIRTPSHRLLTLINEGTARITTEFHLVARVSPFTWLLLPASVITGMGIISMVYGYIIKRMYGYGS